MRLRDSLVQTVLAMELPFLQLQQRTHLPTDVLEMVRGFVPTRPSVPHPATVAFRNALRVEKESGIVLQISSSSRELACSRCGLKGVTCILRDRIWNVPFHGRATSGLVRVWHTDCPRCSYSITSTHVSGGLEDALAD